jgi:GTP-binding protein
MQNNIVAIVGRPNVGKSTFFNRLVGTRKAIMDNEAGVTRDRHYGFTDWNGKFYTVIDTGGYVVGSEDIFEQAIRDQVELAIEECDVIIFMVDVNDGLTGYDKDFAKILRKTKKPVYIAANKADTFEKGHQSAEFYALGFGEEIFPISSQTGNGTGELLDAVVSHFSEAGTEDPYEGIPRISVLGRPNVGKSSFINLLLGERRNIVTDVAGTTRDSIDTHYKAFGKEFILTDTAGIRRKTKLKDHQIEFYSVLRSLQSLENSDVCIIMLDATRGIESQDVAIVALAEKKRKGIVILVNKWDAVEKDSNSARKLELEIRNRLAPIDYTPIMFVSVFEKQRIFQAIEMAIKVHENRSKRIPTSELNDKILEEIAKYPPPSNKGKVVRIKYIMQLPTYTPSFAFFCNLPQYVKEPYQRFLENKMREHFDLEGVPVNIFFRKK